MAASGKARANVTAWKGPALRNISVRNLIEQLQAENAVEVCTVSTPGSPNRRTAGTIG